jgi:uncharacterized protein
MQNPYYEFSVPIFKKGLNSLGHLLDVAEVYAATYEGGEAALLAARLAPDMFPFSRQVQIACDNAKGASARLAGADVPSFADTEITIADLKERVKKTVAFLDTLTETQFADAAARRIELPYFAGKHFIGAEYLKQYAIPNFFFHLTTAYGVLRNTGAPLGKDDYMHGLPFQENA